MKTPKQRRPTAGKDGGIGRLSKLIDYEGLPAGVYLIEAVGSGLAKIGYSADFRRRAGEMAVGSALPLRPLALMPGPRSMERPIHREFRHLHSHGEWFELNDEIRRHFADHAINIDGRTVGAGQIILPGPPDDAALMPIGSMKESIKDAAEGTIKRLRAMTLDIRRNRG